MSRPYPRLCPRCRELTVHRGEYDYDFQVLGTFGLIPVRVPSLSVLWCDACGHVSFDLESDAQINQAVAQALAEFRANKGIF